MKTKKSQLIFILDRSGSMAGLESDTIGGFNSVLKKQSKLSAEVQVTTVLFDDKYEMLHDRINIQNVSPITENQYFVRGSTALLDAMGRTISKIKNIKNPGKILFVVITDGMENASREYNSEKINKMVSDVRQSSGWEFIFLGANIDAVTTAKTYGISADNAVNYHPDSQGVRAGYAAVCNAAAELRTKNSLSSEWKKQAEQDYISRK